MKIIHDLFWFSGFIKEDRNKWSPLTTLNSTPISSHQSPPSPTNTLPAHYPIATHHKNSPTPGPYSQTSAGVGGIIGGGQNGSISSPHSAYHSAAANANSFASPLSALLGTGSHYLFNSEGKGPSVPIF